MGASDDEGLEKSKSIDYGEKAKELKKELKRLAMEIIGDKNEDEDDHENAVKFLGTISKAIQALTALMELKLKKNLRSLSSHLDGFSVPDEFRCPISKELMKEPVILATGQTYDRPFIDNWLKDGHRICPQTQQVLSHTFLTPNHLVHELIARWCECYGIEMPRPVLDVGDSLITEADRDRLKALLEKLSSTLSDQKEAAQEIRLLTKRMPAFRSLFGQTTDAIPQLLSPLLALENLEDHPDLHENIITALLNISIPDKNKELIAEHPRVIPLLIESLRRGTIDTRSNAAAALFTLSALDSNKQLIGQWGALKPLIDLVDEGHPLAMQDAAQAIFNLCRLVENRGRAVHEGAVRVIVNKIMNGVYVDELLSILALLANHQTAIEELGEVGAVTCLLGIIREETCQRMKENSVSILVSICDYNRSKLREVRDEEEANGTISMLTEHGTSRAKRKAYSLLDSLNRVPRKPQTQTLPILPEE